MFHSKIYSPSSSLFQGKHLPFTPSPLRLNICRLFVILSLTQLYRYTPEIVLFSTATFKYKYRAPLRRIRQEYSAKVAFSISDLPLSHITHYLIQLINQELRFLLGAFHNISSSECVRWNQTIRHLKRDLSNLVSMMQPNWSLAYPSKPAYDCIVIPYMKMFLMNNPVQFNVLAFEY